MKQVVTVTEIDGEGLEGLLGERVLVRGLNYFYVGKLTEANDMCIKLEDASIVYEEGIISTPGYTTTETSPNPIYVMQRCIESFSLEF